jgi:O-palmitoleoyl-L-serine hydrolase
MESQEAPRGVCDGAHHHPQVRRQRRSRYVRVCSSSLAANTIDEPCSLLDLVLCDAVKSLYVFSVCMDGTPPAYHLDPGFGAGKNNWIINLEVISTPPVHS